MAAPAAYSFRFAVEIREVTGNLRTQAEAQRRRRTGRGSEGQRVLDRSPPVMAGVAQGLQPLIVLAAARKP